MNDEQIESLLRKAPGAPPPHGLLERLKSDITLPRPAAEPKRVNSTPWFRRWLPALGFAGCVVVCAVVLAVQTSTLSQLSKENESLRAATQNLEQLQKENLEYQRLASEHQELERLRKDSQELQQLRGEIARLRSQVQEIARLKSENQQWRAGAGAQAAGETDDQFFDRVGTGSEKALSIQCINNLKQIGLAARIWAVDNADVLPPQWLAMTNELSTPKILVCPADTTRAVAVNWTSFSPANVTYDFLNPSGSEAEPQVVLARCPIHGHVCLSDGSVQQIGLNRKLIQKDGKYYIGDPNATGDDQTRKPDEILRQRYGLPNPPGQGGPP